ncbi:protein HUA2-LIKE 2 [Ricinus communis]|uniref:protein HUA2-LIKE 2 n=1 Tax=Ricinus communis TaxID=3988 RepID=UPI000772B4AF|nr:protein HUA2-LIKE 2 [Ricinus communis]XP_048233412.1 protein HUA2-LIKE 2 [Ricinus communis]|eukprot:XP_015583234.1 protein HUA2-LIKE 2 [Ricinus communis]
MAPSRRRGAGKAAAAAAAARRQWKVGDLVLAKVKGFPAWPATVSEPEKWGYAADWKKVLVYFFGTQQIAFCNPADVEAFTEEKKQSLLVKRQGKGADFVRAVQEIIESYEKLKKSDQVDDRNSGEEITLVNGGHSMESSAYFELKGQTETSEATVTGRDDPGLAVDVPQSGTLHDKEDSTEQPADNMAVPVKPGIATYTSRKRSLGLRSRKHAAQKNDSSVERSGSLPRLESSRFQNFMLPSNEGSKSAGDASTDVISDRALRRNKRTRRSPDASEWDDVDSSAFVSNGSIEDDGSEIVTVDSDSLSLNEGSTIDSASKPEHSETFVECLEGDVELSKGLDFQIKAVFIKKKRKQNRKRVSNEAAEPPARRLETEVYLDAETHSSSQNLKNAGDNLNERHNKEDGDEHLPLVKRARVRMGKLSSLQEHASFSQDEEKISNEVAINPTEVNNGLCQVEERTLNEVAVATLERIVPSDNLSDDCSADKDSFSLKGALDIASPPKAHAQIPVNRPQILILKESQSFGCTADGEAALPPSKRLHRALEAMSANAAEEGHACAETSIKKTSMNDGSTFSMKGSSGMVVERKENNGSGEQITEGLSHGASAFSSSSNRVLEESVRSPLDRENCNELIESSTSQRHHKDALALGFHNGRDVNGSCIEGHAEDAELRVAGGENRVEDVSISESSRLNASLISLANEGTKGTSLNGSDALQNTADDTACENTETLRTQVDDNSRDNGMRVEAKGNYEQRRKESCYASSSEDHLGGRDGLGVGSSPVPADGMESPAQTSPPTTSICHVSTAESANFIQNSGCSSPNHSQQKTTVCTSVVDEEKIESVAPQRPKSVGKWSSYAEAHAALSSFEGMLGSLTRTKESIGRATRIAIDCAKFGVSAKVVDILARTLESESNLHRRVDLFFLVDSITQCSRGLKGDVGGIYPSAIQAVLPRLLSAAAPPGSFAQENRRQCLKVLRLWLERRILPEPVVRHHMREIDSLGGSSSGGAYSRRSARTERPLDDPVRDMEGMLVDEYGSNSSFQLPGFCMPRMLKDEDEGSDSDGESFEAVTPEHNSETPEEHDSAPAIEKHTHILEDVDGELEMEDVAPSCEIEASSAGGIGGVNAVHIPQSQLEQHFSLPFAPPLPQDVPPSSPPLPTSPPPPPPPPPPPAILPSSGMPDPYVNGVDSKLYTNSHYMHDDLRETVAQPLAAPRITSSITDGVHYHATECRDQMQMQLCDSTSSFSSYPACPVNNVQHADSPNFHHKAYAPRPPHHPPSNQFSYVQAGQHVKSRRASPPPSHHHRYQSSHNTDGGNYYNNHERMRPAPYDESWRYPPPPFPGPRYPDKSRASYPRGPYGGPPREPTRMPHQGWSYPSQDMHHRNFMPFRPPSDAVPVSNRGPGIWRPR